MSTKAKKLRKKLNKEYVFDFDYDYSFDDCKNCNKLICCDCDTYNEFSKYLDDLHRKLGID